MLVKTEYPPMGFNAFDCLGIDMDRARALAGMEVFHQKLYPFGYQYFCFDAGWYNDQYYHEMGNGDAALGPVETDLIRMDGYGRLTASPRKFPGGLEEITARCHELGFQFGLHVFRGIPKLAVQRNCPIFGTNHTAAEVADADDDCIWSCNVGLNLDKPGAQEYYDSVFADLSERGVDFVKVDNISEHPRDIEAVGKAVAKLPRKMVLSLSPGGAGLFRKHLPLIRRYASMLRISGDVWDQAADLQMAFEEWEKWEDLGSPECWLDLDMIPFGRVRPYLEDNQKQTKTHLCRLTPVEKRTFITQRALAASPLFFGGELTTTPQEDFDLVTHPQVLACVRNGVTAKRIYGERHIDIREVRQKDQPEHGWLGLFNRKGVPVRCSLPPEAFGFSAVKFPQGLRDVWTGEPFQPNGGMLSFHLDNWECRFIRF